MKKFLIMGLLMICIYPKQLKIMDSEFSTGTANSPAYMVELSGMENGEYVTYTDYMLSAGKFFGFGRVTAPKKIEFKSGSVHELECK